MARRPKCTFWIDTWGYPLPLLTISDEGTHSLETTELRSWTQWLPNTRGVQTRTVRRTRPFPYLHSIYGCYQFRRQIVGEVSGACDFRVMHLQPATYRKEIVVVPFSLIQRTLFPPSITPHQPCFVHTPVCSSYH